LQRPRNFPVRGAQASLMGRSSHAKGFRPFVANRNIWLDYTAVDEETGEEVERVEALPCHRCASEARA
jgi:hypothetical protein